MKIQTLALRTFTCMHAVRSEKNFGELPPPPPPVDDAILFATKCLLAGCEAIAKKKFHRTFHRKWFILFSQKDNDR